ncbi:pyridoxamine 5'-phosphate oxidase family protein [Litoribaculum gwangyangense]|jgi:nitroimidazol reductase NimA-like FMN-containing flavoprotein (pyridoxamine 5'-phosphate oxidase superfamily)|uniref:Pyridoxamine 5'-phosphate oxidase family protein n=1 Tax=Litoribaculum gwangyangense TaxID=1130722 RepID=A0ABP9CGN8_9FLAO
MIKTLTTFECTYLLKRNYIGYLGYIFNNRPYVVPITYYYDDIENTIIGYSGIGHKIKALRNNGLVSLEVAEIDSVSNWKSVLAHGIYREFEGSSAKINLHKFSERVKDVIKIKEGKHLSHISEFSSKIFKEGIPVVFQIEIEELTGRERQY